MLASAGSLGQRVMQPQAQSSRLRGSSSSRLNPMNSLLPSSRAPCCQQRVGLFTRHVDSSSFGPQQQQQQQQALRHRSAATGIVAPQQQQQFHVGRPLQQPLQLQQRQRQQWQQQTSSRSPVVATAAATAAAAAFNPSSNDAAGESSSNANNQQQQQQGSAALPVLDLPPSRSAALWLNDMSDAELQQAAVDWGYESIGRPLPEGISLTAIAETLPEEVFALNLPKALGYLALSLGVMALGYSYLWYWHSICPLWQQLLAWVVVGTGYYGVFQTAVDCAHFAFWPERPLLQDVLGALLMAPALMSYEIFRLKYFNHLLCTNQLHEDLDAWHPLLPEDLAALPAWQASATALLMATPLKFFASIGQWLRSFEGFNLQLHPKATRFWVWLSWALPLGFIATVWPPLLAAGGVGGLVTYWLGPWLVFHAWLSVMSLIQHTGPHIPWAEEGLAYDQAQATINGTVSISLPRWLEVLLHHSNHHLASHMSVSIPSYNLPAAQAYLQQRLGKYLTTATINANLLRNLMTAWLVYDERQQRYLSFDEAAELVEACKQQQQREQEQQHQQQQQPEGSSAHAAAAAAAAGDAQQQGGVRVRPNVITASIPIEQLLGVPAANGSSSSGSSSSGSSSSGSSSGGSGGSSGGGSRGQQQQQLAGSGSSRLDA